MTPRLSESALVFETCVLGLSSKSSAVIPRSTLSISDRSVALSNCLWQCLPIPDLMLLVCELILTSVSGFSFVWLHMKQTNFTWTMEPCSQLCKVVSVSMLTFSQSTSQSIRRVHPLGTMHKNIKTLVVQFFSYISLDQMHWLLHAPSMLEFSLSTIQDVYPACWPAALTQVREKDFLINLISLHGHWATRAFKLFIRKFFILETAAKIQLHFKFWCQDSLSFNSAHCRNCRLENAQKRRKCMRALLI